MLRTPAWLLALSVFAGACTRDNPGFLDTAGASSETGDDGATTSANTDDAGDGASSEVTGDGDGGDGDASDGDGGDGDGDGDTGDGDGTNGDGDGEGCEVLIFGEIPSATISGVTADTWLEAAAPTGNFGSEYDIELDGGLTMGKTGLLRFDLSALPTTSNVQSAKLVLTTNGDTGSTSSEGSVFGAYLGHEAWDEDTATWAKPTASALWSVEGCVGPPCRGSDPLDTFEPTLQNEPYELMVTDAVAAWVADPTVNFGFVLWTEATNGADVHSWESGEATGRPKLEVTICG